MRAGPRLDQLRGDRKLVADAPDAALHHILRGELATDFRHIDRLAFVDKGRIASQHVIDAIGAEIGDDLFADAVGEPAQGLVAGEIVEGEYRDPRSAGGVGASVAGRAEFGEAAPRRRDGRDDDDDGRANRRPKDGPSAPLLLRI